MEKDPYSHTHRERADPEDRGKLVEETERDWEK